MQYRFPGPMFRTLCTGMICAIGASCSPPRSGLKLSDPPDFGIDPSGWTIRQQVSDPDAGVSVQQTEMPPAERQARESEYAASALAPYPLNSRYNVSLFRLDGVREYEGHLAIAPKILAYGSRTKGKLIPKRNSDGTITLTFSVIFTDGLSQKITAPDDESQISVPAPLLVAQREELEKELNGTKISPLPGCPKEIYIVASGKKYGATPVDMSTVEECPINRPFTVSLTLPEAEAWHLLQDELYAYQAEIRAIWETRLPVPVSRVRVEVDRRKMLESLEAELGVNAGPIVEADLRAAIERAARKQIMKVSIQGDLTPAVKTLVEQAMKEFSAPFSPEDPAMAACPAGKDPKVVCLHLRYQSKEASGVFSAQWEHRTMTLKGSRYMTWGKLKPQLDRASGFEIDNQTQNWVETALTAIEGDMLDIEPTRILLEQHAYSEVDATERMQNVCVRSEPILEEKCHLEFQPLVNSWACLIFPISCTPVPKSICRTEQTGTRCVETQQVKDYNRPSAEMVEVQVGQGALPQMYDGMLLKFTSSAPTDGTPRETICPLSAFQREGAGSHMTIKLTNTPMCNAFVPGEPAPLIYIGSHLAFERRELHGREIRNQAGQVIESPAQAVYTPRVQIIGNLSIRGSAFGNDSVNMGSVPRL